MSKEAYQLIFSVTLIDSDVYEVREKADLEFLINDLNVEATFEDTYQVTYYFSEENDEKAIQAAKELIEHSAFDIEVWSLRQDEREVTNEEWEED